MEFNPACLINIFLAFLALALYIIGSYRFYKNQKAYLLYLGLAILIDVVTAVLASLRITPTSTYFQTAAVPWYSLLFKVHVTLSMIGFLGFVILFIYLLAIKNRVYSDFIRKWQFRILLPLWVVGECIALTNAISKIIFQIRIFDLL